MVSKKIQDDPTLFKKITSKITYTEIKTAFLKLSLHNSKYDKDELTASKIWVRLNMDKKMILLQLLQEAFESLKVPEGSMLVEYQQNDGQIVVCCLSPKRLLGWILRNRLFRWLSKLGDNFFDTEGWRYWDSIFRIRLIRDFQKNQGQGLFLGYIQLEKILSHMLTRNSLTLILKSWRVPADWIKFFEKYCFKTDIVALDLKDPMANVILWFILTPLLRKLSKFKKGILINRKLYNFILDGEHLIVFSSLVQDVRILLQVIFQYFNSFGMATNFKQCYLVNSINGEGKDALKFSSDHNLPLRYFDFRNENELIDLIKLKLTEILMNLKLNNNINFKSFLKFYHQNLIPSLKDYLFNREINTNIQSEINEFIISIILHIYHDKNSKNVIIKYIYNNNPILMVQDFQLDFYNLIYNNSNILSESTKFLFDSVLQSVIKTNNQTFTFYLYNKSLTTYITLQTQLFSLYQFLKQFPKDIKEIYCDASLKISSSGVNYGIGYLVKWSDKSMPLGARLPPKYPISSGELELIAALIAVKAISQQSENQSSIKGNTNTNEGDEIMFKQSRPSIYIDNISALEALIFYQENQRLSSTMLDAMPWFRIFERSLRPLSWNVNLIKVKAHAGVFGNELADFVAKFASKDNKAILVDPFF